MTKEEQIKFVQEDWTKVFTLDNPDQDVYDAALKICWDDASLKAGTAGTIYDIIHEFERSLDLLAPLSKCSHYWRESLAGYQIIMRFGAKYVSYKFISEVKNPEIDFQKAIIDNDVRAFYYIEDPTDEIKNYAISKGLNQTENMSKEEKIAHINSGSNRIFDIKDPGPELVNLAIEKYKLIKYIKHSKAQGIIQLEEDDLSLEKWRALNISDDTIEQSIEQYPHLLEAFPFMENPSENLQRKFFRLAMNDTLMLKGLWSENLLPEICNQAAGFVMNNNLCSDPHLPTHDNICWEKIDKDKVVSILKRCDCFWLTPSGFLSEEDEFDCIIKCFDSDNLKYVKLLSKIELFDDYDLMPKARNYLNAMKVLEK